MKESTTKTIISVALAGSLVSGLPAVASADFVVSQPDGLTMEEAYDDNIVYYVVEGDTLGGICERVYNDASLWELLAEYNHMKLPCQLFVGDKITIPRVIKGRLNGYPLRAEADEKALYFGKEVVVTYEPVVQAPVVETEDETYTVKCGDTLTCITRVFYGLETREAVDKLATYNNLSDPNRISVGQVLYIPSLEKLKAVVPYDYTDEYNRMDWILLHQNDCRPNPCDPCAPKPCDPCAPKPCDPCAPKPCDPCAPAPCATFEPSACYTIGPCGEFVAVHPAPDNTPYQYFIEYENGCSYVLKLKY